jgi:FtsH-binding integral membrane protein
MSFGNEYDYSADHASATESAASERATFIRRTYTHVAGAILGFIALEAVLLQLPIGLEIVKALVSGWWLLAIGAFLFVSWLAGKWAQSDTSRGMQYAGLTIYVVAEAIICLPLLWVARFRMEQLALGQNVITIAGLLTLMVFAGLTLAAFTTKKDFSFLGPIVWIGSLVALGTVIAGLIFGFHLGLWFSFAMVALLSASILYETSAIMCHYRTDQYVAASLALFSSIATLFWVILRILMSIRK